MLQLGLNTYPPYTSPLAFFISRLLSNKFLLKEAGIRGGVPPPPPPPPPRSLGGLSSIAMDCPRGKCVSEVTPVGLRARATGTRGGVHRSLRGQ